MARSKIVTAVSLDMFQQAMGIHPFRFNSLDFTGLKPISGPQARQMLWQESWQSNDWLSREDIARAIKQAEDKIEKAFGFFLRPQYHTEEIFAPNLYSEGNALVNTYSLRSLNTSTEDHVNPIPLSHSDIIAGGVEATSVIAEDQAITFSNLDGDSVSETWTATISDVSVTDLTEVAVYFAEDERGSGVSRNETWRIRPVSLELSGTTLTIRGKRWQVVKPSLFELVQAEQPSGIDGSVDSNFADSIDVVRKYVDNSQAHATITWNDGTSQTGYIMKYRHNQVWVYPGTYTDGAWSKSDYSKSGEQPQKIEVSYQSGLALDENTYEIPDHRITTICQYAVGFLPKDLGSDTPTERLIRYYAEDMAAYKTGANGGGRVANYRGDELTNALGTWRGAIEAWRYFKPMRRGSIR